MYINTTGLVLRETRYKESSKILTVLTADEGKLTVMVRGALRKNSPLAAPTQILTYSELTLLQNRGRWTLTEARSAEQFAGLRRDIIPLALGSYFAELTEAVSDEDSPSPELLRLCLNALYVLSEGGKPAELIKPAFEMRLMAYSGFAPDLTRCASCAAAQPGSAVLDIVGGTIICPKCLKIHNGSGGGIKNLAEMGAGALSAARYILGCEDKRVFSFKLGGDSLKNLSVVTEQYLLNHLDRRFRTLEYYKSIK